MYICACRVRTKTSCPGRVGVPVALAAEVAAGNLEQAVGTVVCDYLLIDTSWTSNLLAIFAVEEVLEGVEAEVGSRGTGIK